MVTAYYSVCPLLLYPYGQLPVSQLSPCREEVSAEELVSARWEQSPATLSWAEMDAEERASPASEGHRFSARKQRLLEQETQPDRTWKPRAAMTHDGHKRRKRSCLLLLLLPLSPPACYPPSAAWRRNKTPEEEGKRRDNAWIAVAPSWTLPPPPSNAWSLMLPKMFRGMQGSFKESFMGRS